jgi:hypothetical protein
MNRLEPRKLGASPTYRQIWRVVDGAVDLALSAHPEYIAPGKNPRTVRNSIVKRVVGAILSYSEQSGWVRSGSSSAHEEAVPSAVTGPAAEAQREAASRQSE